MRPLLAHDAPDAMAGARRFFERRVPELLAAREASARDVAGRCRFVVGDGAATERWVVDLAARPARVLAGDGHDADCEIAVTAADLAEMIDDPAAGQVRAWQGRLRFAGDQALLHRIAAVLFPAPDGDNGAYAGYYTSLSRLVPDPRVTFMNHGYADATDDDLSWCDEADLPWRYAVNLVRRTLGDTRIEGARVLDVGCGRGGPAAYVARLGAREVTGLDACADAVAFCAQRHSRPGLRFVHGHADRLPFHDASLDVVLNVESSHCYLDRPAFFAEVARVLEPGGAFCYADIFQGDELDATRRWLARQPQLRAGEPQDITAGVIRAIERNRERLAELLGDTVDPRLDNAAIVEHLVHAINVQIYDNYVSGRWRYHAWAIEKAVT